jgi:serine/threonine protein phosphatase 1
METGNQESVAVGSSVDSDLSKQDCIHAPIELSDSLRRQHRHFDADQFEDIYIVGDVHGCIDELRTLWARLDPGDADLVVFVGDLIRKGPDSDAVVEFVATRENAISVRGNNEAKIIQERIDTDPFDSVIETIESFPLVVSWDDAAALHGGLDPRKSPAAHSRMELLETRSIPPGNGYDGPFWFELYERTPQVFFGHTVLEEPYLSESAVGLDTGCVYGGSLTAYDYFAEECLSVPASETYQSRAPEKFLDL